MNELMPYILAILALAESNGDPNAPDNGEAVGILQITPIAVEEVNRIIWMEKNKTAWATMCKDSWFSANPYAPTLGKTKKYGFNLSQRKDVEASRAMCELTLWYWLPNKAIDYKNGPMADEQKNIVRTAARLWRGGPGDGYDWPVTLIYADKAGKAFESLKTAKKLGIIANTLGSDGDEFCFSLSHEREVHHNLSKGTEND